MTQDISLHMLFGFIQLSSICITYTMLSFSPRMYIAVRKGATAALARAASTSARRRPVDETTLAGAQHKVSLSGPSLGHLISELSATKPGMEALRQPGQTISEEHRTTARQIAKWMMGVSVVFGSAIVGLNYSTHNEQDKP